MALASSSDLKDATEMVRLRNSIDSSTSDVKRIRVLYIEGFSPGPGLPSPLLDDEEFEVLAPRMPYGFQDHVKNPYGVGLILWLVLFLGLTVELVRPWWISLILALPFLFVARALKRRAMSWCLERCERAHMDAVGSFSPDILIGYSWGGGIASSLVSKGLWRGASLLLAPAGEQMWAHAGLSPPSLGGKASGGLPATTRVLTVQGSEDAVVRLASIRKLHQGSRRTQCRLLVADREDHMLRSTCTKDSIGDWIRLLVHDADKAERDQFDLGSSGSQLISVAEQAALSTTRQAP
mmetsp:Transcript_30440/g.53479  ORF Transcript_30440/g.53479 Transcript_30440/m.53479 type:complete len:294 (-) Transcript_30440:169-1050(-)